MKNYLFLFIGIILLAGTSCQETVDFKKEKEAIIAVIKAEKEAYIIEDMESLKIHNLQDSSYFFMFSSEENFYVNHGYEDQAASLKKGWESRNPDLSIEFDFKVVELKIFPQCAWAVIKVMWKYTLGEETIDAKGIEEIFFEKVEGEWKISGQSVVGASSYEEDDDDVKDNNDEGEEGNEVEEEDDD
jgi:hypothetical protein